MEQIKKIISLENAISRRGCMVPYVGMKKNTMGDFILDPKGCWGKYPYDIDINLCKGFISLRRFFVCEGVVGRASYSHVISKWRMFENLLNTATFYKRIRKKQSYVWKITKLSFKEKINTNIVLREVFDSTPINDFTYNVIGVVNGNEFDENGGQLMLEFLLKYIGIFEVDSKYILIDNYVPEMLYYCEIDDRIAKLEAMRNSGDCCKTQEYNKYGGDEFLNYLYTKQKDRDKEFKYWTKALYKKNGKEVAPSIYLPISLIGECKNIGIYTIVEPLEEYKLDGTVIEYEDTQRPDYGNTKNEPLKTSTSSKLIDFRRRKKTQFFNVISNKWDDMPIVMEEYQEDGTSYMFRVTPRYVVGNAINLVESDNKIYGDVIFKIEQVDGSNLNISYVIGGELRRTDEDEKDPTCPELDIYRYKEESKTGVVYTETVKFEVLDYANLGTYRYKMLILDHQINILTSFYVKNINNAMIIYDSENDEVDGYFYMDYPENMTNHRIIMKDYNFGKIENLVENIEEVILDRGYASAFELHYKLGEINSFEDMQNYQNNIFGL